MSNTINYGIDLGTTNSLIARVESGIVEVFKNPAGHKEALPSAIAYRKNRILIGDKAREYVEKDPANVFTSFKRKMGTSEKYFVPETMEFKSPVDFSAMILQELKNFVLGDVMPQAVVITIPASFDTIQSNATKEAGYHAGFKEVVLLQEPVAASLAFANRTSAGGFDLSGQWLVFDLGGGTFDCALVRFEDEEMRIVDHEGDNYLGGLDFDSMIMEKILLPQIAQHPPFGEIESQIRTPGHMYQKLHNLLLHEAEEAKIDLSARENTLVEIDIEDEDGQEHSLTLTVHRSQFEELIKPQLDHALSLVQRLLDKNNLAGTSVNEIIMIGGSTYIPFVRKMLEQELGIAVNASIDPTTAVAIGAAWFAGTRRKKIEASKDEAAEIGGAKFAGTSKSEEQVVKVRTAFARNTRALSEYFAAQVDGIIVTGNYYRIQRKDGGFDTGIKPLTERVTEMLPLLPNVVNDFRFVLLNPQQQPIPVEIPLIEIVQGMFSIEGQPLPADICLEVDDPLNKTTKLEVVFEKNSILPLRRKITREVTRTVKRNSDESLVINILEGSRYASPASNLPIGIIEIRGSELRTDLVKGSDIEVVLEINESRDLNIQATLLINEQEFGNLFTPSVRTVSLERLKGELNDLMWDAENLLQHAEREERYEAAAKMQSISEGLTLSVKRAAMLKDTDASDEKYQLEERKRLWAREIDEETKNSRISSMLDEYVAFRDATRETVAEDEKLKARFERIIAEENSYLASGSKYVLNNKIQELRRLSWELNKHKPEVLINSYMYCDNLPDSSFSIPVRARDLLEKADHSIERQNYHELLAILYQIWELVIDPDEREKFSGTGLG